MDECEFKGFCDYTSLTMRVCVVKPEECQMYRRFVRILNSPQFKKQYAKLSVVKKVLESLPVKNDDFVRDVMAEIEIVGRTNP